VIELDRTSSEAAATGLERRAWFTGAALGLQRKRTAEGVETVYRIGARNKRDFRNSDFGDKIPTDNIAERLVESNAVHIYGYAFWRAEEGRGCVAAIVNVGLEGVVLRVPNVIFRTTRSTVVFPEVVSIDLTQLSKMFGTEVAGVVGFDFLQDVRVTLDYHAAEVRLSK